MSPVDKRHTLSYNKNMDNELPVFTYSPEKNAILKAERDISFEEIIAAIGNGQLLDILEHPNKTKYAHQKIYVVLAKGYIYLVPVVPDKENALFMKTIIPSRQAVKKYKDNKNEKKNKA
ncbi:MAG: hypothetical protein LLF94_04085 [Chlamydiales bacterium]|nr:hypothetical protein [Chlamydiales bacterium]